MSKRPPKRKPGAQPGNTNAVKHGLYRRHLNEDGDDHTAEAGVGPEPAEDVHLARSFGAEGGLDVGEDVAHGVGEAFGVAA